MDEMAARLSLVKSLLPEFQSTLQAFNASSAKFRIIRTVNPTSTAPKTLYILDSSFNPPSIAHRSLAISAVTRPAASDKPPFRLLLLFSTHNADKAPSPAAFDQRLALMTLFAEDLGDELKQHSVGHVSIDIGLTKEPYYTDKSAVIDRSSPPAYPSKPTHVHLVGYDTITRFCNPKYYPNHDPPLSALAPFFEAGHTLRVTERPYNAEDASSKEFGTAQDQKSYLQRLQDGELQKDGLEKSWAERLELVPATAGVGVSSTRVRHAAKQRDWATLRKLTTPSVAEWVQSQALYASDDSGKKLMS